MTLIDGEICMCKSVRIPVIVVLLLLATSVQAQPPGRQRGRGRFGRGGPNSLLAFLVSMAEVQKELKIDAVQEKLLDALLDDLREQQRGAFQGGLNGPRGDREAQFQEFLRHMQKLNRQGEDLLTTIFEPEQRARFNQIRIQYEGVRALDRDEVAQVLGLTDTQLKVIREIRERDEPPDGSRDREVRRPGQQSEADMLAVFTEEQKKKWEDMQGKAFVFPRRSRWYGRRGFGGPGRGGGERPRRQRPPSDR